jgi:hypothetical protein
LVRTILSSALILILLAIPPSAGELWLLSWNSRNEDIKLLYLPTGRILQMVGEYSRYHHDGPAADEKVAIVLRDQNKRIKVPQSAQISLIRGNILEGSYSEFEKSAQCSAVQCSAVQCSAVQCSSVQCSAVQCSAVQD